MNKKIVFIIAVSVVILKTCLANNCAYYLDLEINKSCFMKANDSSDYLTNYGYTYCRKFESLNSEPNSRFNLFITKTRTCLQDKLKMNVDKMPCSEIEKFAFNSHPDCYQKSGYCNITKEDSLKVFSIVLGLNLLFKIKESINQYINVISKCITEEEYSGIAEVYQKISEDQENLKELGVNMIKEVFLDIPQSLKGIKAFFISAINILKNNADNKAKHEEITEYLKLKYTGRISKQQEECFYLPNQECLAIVKKEKFPILFKAMKSEIINNKNDNSEDINLKLKKIAELKRNY